MAVYGGKICEQCGESYEAAVGWQRFCSDECAKQWAKNHPYEHKGKVKAKVCEQCGDWFEPKKNVGKRQRFCSEECQRQWWIENRGDAGKVYRFVCQNCGKEYETLYSNRDTCCSRECSFEWAGKQRSLHALIEKQCLSCGLAFQGAESGSDYCSDECHDRGMKRVCVVCGSVFYGNGNACYCSDECRLEAGRRQYEEYATEKVGDRTYVCKECGREFIAPYGDKRHGFCSNVCSRRHHGRIHKRTRRALKKCNGQVDRINPLDVYERDNWYCGICGGKVDKILEYPHPHSASLDHIVPLSCGGEHTLGNVQLAHLQCNVQKSNVGGGQLHLGLEFTVDIA